MNKAKPTFVRIVDPRLTRQDTRERDWKLSDYVTVPRLSTYGTFNFGDFLSDDSIRNLLKVYAVTKNMAAHENSLRRTNTNRRVLNSRQEKAMRA